MPEKDKPKMSIYKNLALRAPRPAFIEAQPELKASHRAAQKHLFGVAAKAGLSRDKEEMLLGINALFGSALTSRTQMTVDEMEAVTTAIEAGAFRRGWELSGLVRAEIVVSVQISLTVPARLCLHCAERPVHYFLADERGELVDGESGVCRECCPRQSDEEAEALELQARLSTPASEAVVAFVAQEFERARECEEAQEAAVAQLETRAASLRGRIEALTGVINDKSAMHSKENRKVLFAHRRSIRLELVALRLEFPLLDI